MDVTVNRLNLLIKLDLQDANITVVKSDVEQIIINLIDNAIKYTKGDIIEISLRSSDFRILFSIKNTCNTIPGNIKEKLLEPFVKYNRYKGVEKSLITSSGLGLYLCNEIAKRNDFILTYEILQEEIVFDLIIII
ncbi:sensor histidine kinase [Clostridium gasigenes]|uniref:sensor histidine kinase n=1 Tax=Clostridium gasigenes TaxID=94869 RepID=UPI001C0E4C1E|nr:sensor histidine kinase [Clostridium gasigenes]MBU3102787.1 sensor histidine kinase [Clostridium gasigenes]